MMKLGLIGNSIAKSKAPELHRFLGTIHGIDVTYELFDPVDSSQRAFEKTLNEVINQGLDGCNITFPFKQIALSKSEEQDPACVLVGSTNTLKFDNTISATNTDFSGFKRAITHRLSEEPIGKALLLGAGGVGRAVAFGVAQLSQQPVYIYDPSIDRANDLAHSLKQRGFESEVVHPNNIDEYATSVQGILNCSPIGHYKTPGIPLKTSLIGNQSWVFDAVYTPLKTPLIEAALNRNLNIISGLDLFFYQGLDAFEFWTDIAVDEHEVRKEFIVASKLEDQLI